MHPTWLLLAVVITIVIFLTTRGKKSAGAERAADKSARPDYEYEGRAYVSLANAARRSGSGGWKTKIAFFKDAETIRISVEFGKPRGLDVFELDPGDINEVTYLRDPWVLVIEHHSDAIDLPELIVYPGHHELRDRLLAAKQAASNRTPEPSPTQRHEAGALAAAAAASSHATPAGVVEFCIGEKESSPGVQRLIRALGPITTKNVYDDTYYLNFPGMGVSLCFAKSGVLLSAFLYAEDQDGFSQYTGRLPHDFKFTDTRRTVESTLGAPKASGGGKINCWLSCGGLNVTFKSKSEADLETQIAHLCVSERGLFLEQQMVDRSTPPAPQAAREAQDGNELSPPAAPPEPPKGDEIDSDFDALLEEIRVACETAPERGLALIEGYVSRVDEQPFLRFSRIVAYRRILVGSEADVRSGRYGHKLDEAAQRLTAPKLDYGLRALHEIAQLEQADANYFMDGGAKENILDAVCHLMERARPGIVQSELGWTKLDYFGRGRLTQADERLAGQKLNNISARTKAKLSNTRSDRIQSHAQPPPTRPRDP